MISFEKPTVMNRWPILRVRAGSVFTCELASGEWVRLVTHWGRRTFLCPETEECDACKIIPGRAYWYLPVCSLSTRKPALVELSATASADLEQVCRFAGHRVGPGAQVQLARQSAKKAIRVEWIGQASSAISSPIHEWGSCLMAIYGLPPINLGETLSAYGERVAARAASIASFQAALLTAAKAGRV